MTSTAQSVATTASVDRSVPRVVVVASLGILIAYLPIAGVSVVLGAIAAATGASTPDLQWVTASYVLAMAAAVLTAGVIGDIYGRRRVLTAGFALMTLGAGAGFAAGLLGDAAAIHLLWAGQAAMGLGAGALLTSTLAFVSHSSPDQHQRTRNMAIWASAVMLGSGLGPFLTGYLISFASWNFVYLPLGGLALAMIPAAVVFVPESAPVPDRRLDLPGQATAVVGVTALVFGIIEGGAIGWGSAPNLIGLVVGVIMIVAFMVLERRSAAPLVRLDLFGSAGFTVAALAALVALFAITGTAFVLSLFFSLAQHLSVLQIAVRVAFLFAFAAVFGPLAGRMQKVMAAGVPLITGLLIATVGIGTLTGLTTSSSLTDAGWRLAVAGAGIGMVSSTVTSVAIHSVPHPLAGMAGATNTLFRQVGGALGPAVVGAVATVQLSGGHTLTDALHVGSLVVGGALAATALLSAGVLFLDRPAAQPA